MLTHEVEAARREVQVERASRESQERQMEEVNNQLHEAIEALNSFKGSSEPPEAKVQQK